MSDYSVIVRKGEIFVKHWDTEVRDHVEKKKTEQVLSDVLQFPLLLEDTTFEQFFTLIAREKDLYEKIFNAALFGHPLEPFIQECALPDKKDGMLDYVEVHWVCHEEDGELEFSPSFHGWGDWPHQYPGSENDQGPKKGGIAIEYSPLNEYKHLPFKLNTESNIYTLKQREPLVNGTRKFSVYDVIKGILFEITWAGDITNGRNGLPWEKSSGSEAA